MIGAVDRSRARLLFAEARLLLRLRLVVGGIVTIAGIVGMVSGEAGAWRLVALGALAVAASAVLAASGVLRLALARGISGLLTVAGGQVVFDVVCLSLLTAWTGGAQSPALFLFPPQMLFVAGLLLPVWPTLGLASLAIVGVLAAVAWPLGSGEWPMLVAWGASLIATVLLARRVARALHDREAVRIGQIRRIRAMASELRAQHGAHMQDEKLVAIGQLAAGVAHEITNPLAAMDSILQLMQRKPDQPRPEAVNTLREQVQRILQIVRQLTSYAHPSRGIVDTVSLDEVVRSAIELMAIGKRGGAVQAAYGLGEGRGVVRLNPQAVQQVVTNLLVNALDAVEGREGAKVEVRTSRDGQWCVIEVADNGTGIAPEHMARIFEPFFTTKPVGRGTGLGLSICTRLVEEQGGQIDVRSEPGEGATFIVRLPCAQRGRGAGAEGAPESRGGQRATGVGAAASAGGPIEGTGAVADSRR